MRSALILLLTVTALTGCAGSDAAPAKLEPGQTVVNPFAPSSIRVHPLTHLDNDAEGRPMIVLHVELRDAWGESCKGVGAGVVEMYRPALGPGSGLEEQELVWEVDLYDLTRNARLYDPATRTYRLQLANLPNWITINRNAEAGRRVRLTVTITAPNARGEQIILEDAYVLRY